MGFFSDILKTGTGLVAGIAQVGLGIGQIAKSRKMQYPELEQYNIPDEYLENMSDAQVQALIGLPEAQKREFIENIQRTGASALQQSGTRKGGLGLVSSIAQQRSDAFKSLMSADVEARQRNISQLLQVRQELGQQGTIKQQRAFDIVDTKRALRDNMLGAGFQNIGGGLGTMAGGGTQLERTNNTKAYSTQNSFSTAKTFLD